MSVRRTLGLVTSLTVASLVSTVAAAHAVGVDASLVASVTSVEPGTEFEVRLHVENLGIEFNTYEALIGYDPARLTFLQAVPVAAQEGPYMTGACGNTFHLFEAQPAALHITHSLLCLNHFLATGGDLYILRFRANATGGTTAITFSDLQFRRAGSHVAIQSMTEASVTVSGATDASAPGASLARLAVAPNPFNPTTVVTIESPAAGFQRVLVHDSRGRLVATLAAGHAAAGTRRIVWRGTADSGERLASGMYIVSVHTAAGNRSQSVVLLK